MFTEEEWDQVTDIIYGHFASGGGGLTGVVLFRKRNDMCNGIGRGVPNEKKQKYAFTFSFHDWIRPPEAPDVVTFPL